MRLLYLTNGYPPRHTAGTENYTAGIAKAMVEAGHTVEVLCAGNWATGPRAFNGAETATHDGVVVRRLNLNWQQGRDPNRALFDNPATERAAAEHLRAFSPNLVHLTSPYTLSASVARAVRQAGIPLVVTLTDFWFLCPQVTLRRSDGALCDGQTTAWECLRCMLGPSGAYRRLSSILPNNMVQPLFTWASRQPALARQRGLRGMALDMAARKRTLLPLLAQAAAVIAPSRFLADTFAANGFGPPIRVMPYGHDLSWTARVKPRPCAGPVVAGYAGRLTEVKGVHVLVEAAAQLAPSVPLEVRLYGDLEQELQYSERLRALAGGSPRIRFMGRFGRDQLADVYSAVDVMVVPSVWYENNPLVVQEAFAAGRPVIASHLGGLAEFVQPGRSGWLFPAGDPAALADQLRTVALAPEQIEQLRATLPPVRSAVQERAELEALYAGVLAGA